MFPAGLLGFAFWLDNSIGSILLSFSLLLLLVWFGSYVKLQACVCSPLSQIFLEDGSWECTCQTPPMRVLFATGGICFAFVHLMELEDAKGRPVHLQKWQERLVTSKIIPSQLWMCSSLEVFCVISKLAQVWVCVLSFPLDAYLEKSSPKVAWIFKLSLWKTATTDQFAQTRSKQQPGTEI